MDQQIGIEDVRRTIRDLVDQVSHTRRPVTITRYGRPAARITPLDEDAAHEAVDSVDMNAVVLEDEIDIEARDLRIGDQVFLDDRPTTVTRIQAGRSSDPAMGSLTLLLVSYADGQRDEYDGDYILTVVNPRPQA